MGDTLDRHKTAILEALLDRVPFDGWTSASLRGATEDAGLPEGAEDLYFPGGVLEAIRYWNLSRAETVRTSLAARSLDNMRVRDRVAEGVVAVMRTVDGHEIALRRALARLALPDALGQAPRQAWTLADAVWRGIGDTSTDANYYSKRAILSGVIATTGLSWLADPDPDKAEARAFLDRRIDNVMQIEKAKGALRGVRANLPNPVEALGRLRYGGSPAVRRRRRSR